MEQKKKESSIEEEYFILFFFFFLIHFTNSHICILVLQNAQKYRRKEIWSITIDRKLQSRRLFLSPAWKEAGNSNIQ